MKNGISFLCCLCLLLTGCNLFHKNEAGSPKLVPVNIQVLDQNQKPVRKIGVEIVTIIPKEKANQLGAIPVAMLTDEDGQVKKDLSTNRKYVITVLTVKKEILVSEPTTLTIIINRKK